ncbi:hypothetical protein [Chryseobacterium sp. Marseille-Q3244]|uniref:hypothetical protein n=1 Tax=Chryseobacterium sp. Marseille-Q3244 TaxID=2758092 RepID=UPI00202516B3|nr:hypothetical protein [Chryseobacterium sp. Marseille-Q3244]
MKPYDVYQWSRFYENNEYFFGLYPEISIKLTDSELLICSIIIDTNNYSILTTQKLITSENGIVNFGEIKEAEIKNYGDFKDYKTENFTFGKISLKQEKELKYFIEIGKASMVMIQGVKTLIQIKDTY